MPAAEQKKIEIKIEIEQKLKVYADPDMVRTVCRNLVSNALKFTHSNGLITISATKRDNSILTMIEDTGVGIADELLDSLFKPGSTVSKPGTSNEVGTGLGLLICQEFVGINGGEIWVESKINIGSKFYFTLPLEH